MSERLRSILAVAVLTIAIWVWADLEQTDSTHLFMPVRVSVPADYVVRTMSPERVSVTFTGPRGEIQSLQSSPDVKVCRFDLTEADLKSKRVVLRAADGFRPWADRRVLASDVRSVPPGVPDGEIHVVVDHLVRIQVRVEPHVTGAVVTAATVQPPEVAARVAESELNALPAAKRFAVAPLVISSVPQNQQVEREVPLDRRLGGADGIEASFDPPIVKVTARLESSLTTKSLGRLPILLSAPPEVLNRYRVVFQAEAERWVELEVQGAAPDVERLTPQDILVLLVLTADDKPDPASWLPRKPVVQGLPPNVKLTKPLPTINFNLEKQGEKPPTP